MSNKGNKPIQPDWDAPLALTISANDIMQGVLDAPTMMVNFNSLISTDEDRQDLVAESANGTVSVRMAEREGGESVDFIVEIEVGNTFIYGAWTASFADGDAEYEFAKRKAEDAFIRAAALAGKRVRRGLIVE